MGRPRRLDHTSSTLREEIEHGRFKGLALLPGERQLAAELQVSRTTLRRALAELIDDGLLSQRQGMGTFVNGAVLEPIKKPDNKPLVYVGMTGRIDRVVELSRGCDAPSMDEAMTFGIGPDEDVFRLTQLTFVRGRPNAVSHHAAPLRYLPPPANVGSSLPEAVASRGLRPIKTLQRLRFCALSEGDAVHLGSPPETPAMSLHEGYFLADGGCCVLGRAYYVAETFDAMMVTPVPEGRFSAA